MRNEPTTTEAVAASLRRCRYEVLPTARSAAAVVAAVPRDVPLTVTASPTKGLGATLDLTAELVGEGYVVVPHLAARMISGPAEVDRIVERLTGLGVADVFCPAGDAEPPVGEYAGALPLLAHLTKLGRPFAEVGITGYPESHPTISDEMLVASMADKAVHATYLVSNMCFDAATVGRWVRRVRERGVDLPLLLGLPGPVERTKLLSMATRIGVGQSVRFLRSHAGTFARIAAPGGYRPERFLRKSAGLLADPAARVAGLHFFTFNQVAETEDWRQRILH
jgi:methylenetetrahydrofolate reductase (NADPH)